MDVILLNATHLLILNHLLQLCKNKRLPEPVVSGCLADNKGVNLWKGKKKQGKEECSAYKSESNGVILSGRSDTVSEAAQKLVEFPL